MFRIFRGLKLYFTDRPYYVQWKRYMKRQKGFRKQLIKQAKEFCPWSGWYMNEMIKTMLNFYYKTYESQDCCWSESARTGKITESLKAAIDEAKNLEWLEDLDHAELINVAKRDGVDFYNFLKSYEEKVGYDITNEALLSGVAYSYLEEKYTKAMYNIIGEHIWEWCD